MNSKRNYVLFMLARRRYGDVGTDYKWYANYHSRAGLIHRIALNYGHDGCILNHLSKDMHETECKYSWVASKYAYGDGYFRDTNLYFMAKIDGNSLKTIKAEDIIDEVVAEVVRLEVKKAKRRKAREAEKRMENSYKFRRDPVPKVHNHKNWHRGCLYRHPATTRSKRYERFEDEDLGIKFSDARIRNLPNVYDDIVRHRDKSWKTSCKVKKQWQKHFNNHKDTLEYDKCNLTEEM